MALIRRPLLGLGLLALASLPAYSGIPISAPAPGTGSRQMDEQHLNAAMQDAFVCVAAALAYRPAEAEPACTSLIAAVPDEVLGYKFRGLAYLLEQRFEKAEEDFHVAVRLDPKDSENQAGYGQAMAGQGRFAQAIPRFEAALRLAPRDVRYLAASCWARAGEGNHLDLALRDCNRALQIAPGFATALQNRGLVRLKQSSWRAAIQDYTAALTGKGDRPTALFGRGLARLKTDELQSARADIQAARRIDPQIDDLYILQKVLPASCRDASASCPLPTDLRNPRPSQSPPLWAVSYRPSPTGQTPVYEDMDETLRVIELARLDAMLERTAMLMGVTTGAGFDIGWQDAELKDAARHLSRIRQEYQYQQGLACQRKLLGGTLCQRVIFDGALTFIDSSAELRREIGKTMTQVLPFWRAMCLGGGKSDKPCEIE